MAVRRAPYVAGLVLALTAVAALWVVVAPRLAAERARTAIEPGMAFPQVLGDLDDWARCEGASRKRPQDAIVIAQRGERYVVNAAGDERVFATDGEFFRALRQRIEESGSSWHFRLSFPSRAGTVWYFDFETDPHGRITIVAPAVASR